MQGAVERFQTTIAQLTDVARLQQAHNPPTEQVAVAEAVEAVRLDLLPQLTQAHAQLRVEVPADLHVSFAPKNLRSVVYNLLSNAM
jgi:signal transduction histidine kinase